MARKNGWKEQSRSKNKQLPLIPNEPTRFDLLLKELHVPESTAFMDPVVCAWVRKYYRTCFVPELILDHLRIPENMRAF